MNIIIILLSLLNLIVAFAFVGLKFLYRVEAPTSFIGYIFNFLVIGLPGLVSLALTLLKIKGYPIATWHIIVSALILCILSLSILKSGKI